MNSDNNLALELVKYRVLGKLYSKWRAIIAETGESDTAFLLALKQLHNITVDKKADPMLFITQDTNQMREWLSAGVVNPTLLQLLLTTKVIALTKEDAEERFARMMELHNRKLDEL